MSNVFFSSDLHFGHNKEFIYKARGFDSIEDMNKEIIKKWNEKVARTDTVYLLGDMMLGNNEHGLDLVSQLHGKIYVIRGNHDTDTRVALYRKSIYILDVYDSLYLRKHGYHFYLTHFPCLTGNLERESLKQMTLNLHGHTHASKPFFYDLPYCYNVGVDAHNCSPVSMEEIINDMNKMVEECKSYL